MDKIILKASHAEQKNADNIHELKKRIEKGDYRAYHTADGRVIVDFGKVVDDEPKAEGCPVVGCCIPAGSC